MRLLRRGGGGREDRLLEDAAAEATTPKGQVGTATSAVDGAWPGRSGGADGGRGQSDVGDGDGADRG